MAQPGGFTVWFTGMLGAGKTTLTDYLAARLRQVNRKVEVLDEDSMGEIFWPEAQDTKEDRKIIARRLANMADLLSRNGVATLVACTSPYKASRDEARRLIDRFVEVYVDCPTEKLIQRDTTGKYKKALSGEIPNFIGITEPYEPPNSPEVTILSGEEGVEAGGLRVFQALLDLSLMTTEELKVITGTRMKVQKGGPKKTAGKGAPKSRPAIRMKPPTKSKSAKGKR